MRDANLCVQGPRGRFHFILFETRRMPQAVELIRRHGSKVFAGQIISMTGGGAHKFARLFVDDGDGDHHGDDPDDKKDHDHDPDDKKYGEVQRPKEQDTFQVAAAGDHPHRPPTSTSDDTANDVKNPQTQGRRGSSPGRESPSLGLRSTRILDEMRSLVDGLNFLLKHVEQECFYLPLDEDDIRHPSIPTKLQAQPVYVNFRTTSEQQPVFPYMLVNIGTGVSILKVNADGSYERISGSGLGGGTYWGRCS